MTKYAAIGTDGMRDVVWGLGDTEEAAEQDARECASESDVDPGLTRTVAVTDETAARIESGDIDADIVNGWTFTAWLTAAGRPTTTPRGFLHSAWRAGESPAEYRFE